MRRVLEAGLCLALLAACATSSDRRQTTDAKLAPAATVAQGPVKLPAQVAQELAPEIARQLTEDDHLAAAPGATRESFGYSYGYEDAKPKDPFTSQTDVTYDPLPERGFLVEREVYTEADGYRKTSTTYYAAAGLLRLLEISESAKGGEVRSSKLRLVDYRITGDLYPVAVRNRFSVEMKLTGDHDMPLKHDCEVTGELSAQTIDPALHGRAFYVFCGVEMFDEPPGGQAYLYVEELDFFLPNYFPEACKSCSDFRVTVK
jgi:hypothetical protein